jgi:hypothetical protein
MKVLVDECVDWRLLRDLHGHDVKTVKQMGWEHVKNGALLKLAATQFDVFLTVDQHLPHQQNIARLNIAVIVMRARTTRLADLRALLVPLRRALETARDGEIQVIDSLSHR